MLNPIKKLYLNDFDGNILNAPTTFYFEKKQIDGTWEVVEVVAHDYDANREKYDNREQYRFVDNDMDISYQNFQDFSSDIRHQGPDRLTKDIIHALDNGGLAASFPSFKNEALVEAQLFALPTARANGPDNLKRGVQLINKESLTKEEKEQQIENIKKKYNKEKISDKEALKRYFDINYYLPVNNIEFQKYIGMPPLSSPEKKARVMNRYICHITPFIKNYQIIDEKHRVKLGFSDDDKANTKAMLKYFAQTQQNPTSPHNYYDYTLYCSNKKEEVRNEILQYAQLLGETYPSVVFKSKNEKIFLPKDTYQTMLKIALSSR